LLKLKEKKEKIDPQELNRWLESINAVRPAPVR
jgi:hypothetical protein